VIQQNRQKYTVKAEYCFNHKVVTSVNVAEVYRKLLASSASI